MLIRETARRVAGYQWVEEQLFERTGRWAADGGEPAVRRLLSVQSRHHGWRAAMWAELVPVLHDVDLVPGADDIALLDAVATDADPARRLPALMEVLRELIGRYDAHGASATEVADAPVARVLRLVLVDARADLAAAEAVRRDVER